MTALTEEEKRASRARNEKRRREEQALKQYNEREHLRGEIQSRKYIGVVDNSINILRDGYERIVDADGTAYKRELDRTRQHGLKLAAELSLRMLGKTMPDLKQIELRADVTQEVLPQAITFTVVKPNEDYEAA